MKRDLSYSGGGGSGSTVEKPDFGDLVLSNRELSISGFNIM